MKHKTRRFLAALLCLCMALTLLPGTALAAFAAESTAEGIALSGGFRAASATSETYNKGMTNCMFVCLNKGESADQYVYTYQCTGAGSEGNIAEKKVESPEYGGTQYPYARWTVEQGDLKPGEYTIHIYDKESYPSPEENDDSLGSFSFTLVEYTFKPGEGTISVGEGNGGQKSVDDFVAFAQPQDFYFNVYTNLTVTPTDADGKQFLGWSEQESPSPDDPYKDLIGSAMPECSDETGKVTLYAVYGTPKITEGTVAVADDSPNSDKAETDDTSVKFSGIELESGYTGEQELAKVKIQNTGNQSFAVPNFTEFGPFTVKSDVTKEEESPDEPYISGTFIHLPKKDNTVTYPFSLP